jgi:hypothetical protein
MTAKSLRNGIRERKKEVGGKSVRCLAHVVLTFKKSKIFFPFILFGVFISVCQEVYCYVLLISQSARKYD